MKMALNLVTTLHMSVTKNPEAPILRGADKNSTSIRPILTFGLKIKQLVDLPTKNGKIFMFFLMIFPNISTHPK